MTFKDLSRIQTPTQVKAVGPRSLPSGPSRILDAPDLIDDYYLNLLSWGSNNVIAVALRGAVYLWGAADGNITQLHSMENPDDYITSLQWSKKDDKLAIGTSTNVVELWDTTTMTKLRDLPGHTARVSALSWNGSMLSSGGRDSVILHHDVRQRRHLQCVYTGHQQEVCGLAWSPDGQTLASGGNENYLCLWDAAMSSRSHSSISSSTTSYAPRVQVFNPFPIVLSACFVFIKSAFSLFVLRLVFVIRIFDVALCVAFFFSPQISQHQAAVKALAWCPFQRNILASGGQFT